MKPFKRLFSVEDILNNFGYDLLAIANQGGFPTVESTCEAWCDEAALSIHLVISQYRGIDFTKKIYEMIEEVDESGKRVHEELYDGLLWAQLYEMVFIIENGRDAAVATISNVKKHSSDAIELLYNVGILNFGM